MDVFLVSELTHIFLNNNHCAETWLGIKVASITKGSMNNLTEQGYTEKILTVMIEDT